VLLSKRGGKFKRRFDEERRHGGYGKKIKTQLGEEAKKNPTSKWIGDSEGEVLKIGYSEKEKKK